MKKVSLALLIFFISASGAFGFDIQPFGYVWMNGAHYQTNLAANDFNGEVGRIETKVGVSLIPLWAQASVQPYLAYYGVSSSDRHSYYNNSIAGFGVQVQPLLGVSSADWLQDLKVFYESLTVTWNDKDVDDPNDNPENNYTTDSRCGLDIWHTWNEPGPYIVENRNMLWGELWANLSYRSTNFEYDKFDDYIANFQPRVGIYLFKFFDNVSIEPYLRLDLITSGKSAYYLNNADYGAGLRIRPFLSGKLFGSDVQFLKKLKLFVEVLAVSYLKDPPPDTADFVNHDFRIGIDFDFGR